MSTDQVRKYERRLNPKRKGAEWMTPLEEKELNYIQAYQFGEQNNSFSMYNIVDFNNDKEFYDKFIGSVSPSATLPQIVIDSV